MSAAAAKTQPDALHGAPVYQLSNVGKTYARNAIKALEGVNMTLTKGSFSAVIGSSGCGKSTLLKIMSGLIPPSTGRVVLQGKPVTGPRRDIGMMFQQAIGTDLTTVPFTGTAPALQAMLGGQVDLLCDQTTQTIPQIKADKVKLYGVTTANRIKALPTTPTLAEGGLKGFEMMVWHGVYAPKGTPKAITDKMNAAVRGALKDPDVVKRFTDLGVEFVPESKLTSDGLLNWLKSETERYGVAIRAAAVFAD